jgi:uncharacterized protein
MTIGVFERMRLIGSDLILATSDLTKFVRCAHATFLDRATKSGTITPLAVRPPSLLSEFIAEKGNVHENAYVEQLRGAGNEVVVIGDTPWSRSALQHAEAETLEAMRGGADYICQAAFFDGRWNGRADLLMRVELPSPVLGAWSYEVLDTKLARRVKAHFVLQLADYSTHLTRLQGVMPESMHVVLGTLERASFHVDDYAAYHRHVRHSVERLVEGNETPLAYPVEFCTLCDWSAHCWKQWNAIDHLSLVANIRRTQTTRLERENISTMTALAETGQLFIRRIPRESFSVLSNQARLQLEYRRSGQHTFELLPSEPERGFARLPHPAPGDVFLDVEGDPFVGDGLTYLFGAAWEEVNGESRYERWWAHDLTAERSAFEGLMDLLVARSNASPGMHIYHYGAMDVATLKRLMGRHGTRENELDTLLRGEAFVDLSAVVRQGMRISHSSYGLKKVETFYFDREAEGVADAGGAILAYEQWLESGDPAMLDEIEAYNREDCLSIVAMRRWLLRIRPVEVEWPAPPQVKETSGDKIDEEQKNDTLFQQLVAALPLDRSMHTPEQHASWMLGHLLYYHRREDRPGWWAYFERQTMTDEQLIDDRESIAALRLDTATEPVKDKKSMLVAFSFPAQEHKFKHGDDAFNARDGKAAGEVSAVDDKRGCLVLRRGPSLAGVPPPSSIMPKPSVDSTVIRKALRRFAEAILSEGMTSSSYSAASDILCSRPPRLSTGAELVEMSDACRRLDGSYLFVQGPPGSGKTYAAARTIVGLMRDGHRIGVMSSSHKAIHNLLDEIENVAAQQRYVFQGLKKNTNNKPGSVFTSKLAQPMIASTGSIDECADRSISLIAGTAWLFSEEKVDRSLDYLFIDEAGQIPLANAVATSTSARNVVLLGDPLQLAQVSQGSHPDAVGASVLEHLLGTHATVPRDRGIFLEETWRMHPDVCAFVSEVVYERRLRSVPQCSIQAATIDGVIETGLRFMAVEHEGNSQSSDEEAARIVTEIQRVLRGTFTDASGMTAPLRQTDILVVAAYNAQVRRIDAALSTAGLHEIPVGTVDKFQGRQAPVVFFSMATSSGAELPRDIEFLFSRNRLNVAISRARCLAILVASPHLLDVDCKRPEQMHLVNSLCRFVEMARLI